MGVVVVGPVFYGGRMRMNLLSPPSTPPSPSTPSNATRGRMNINATHRFAIWAAEQQAVLDECYGWIRDGKHTYTERVPRSARVLGGFTSQYRQDMLIWKHLFNSTTSAVDDDGRPRVYVEAAAAHHKMISNSYFFDRCLHWRGLCVEPNPIYHAGLRTHRRCELAPTCASESVEEVEMYLPSSSVWEAVYGGAATSPKILGMLRRHHNGTRAAAAFTRTRLLCVRLQDEFDRMRFQRIDVLFMDMEGSEGAALRSIDFARTQIDYVVCEWTRCNDVLEAHGFVQFKLPTWAGTDLLWRRGSR